MTRADGYKRGEVASLQSVLAALGFEPGAIDGLFGPRTMRAFQAWQRAVKRPVTGYPTPEEMETLGVLGDAALAEVDTRATFSPLSPYEREKLFGKFTFVPHPAPSPRGAPITILGGWEDENIVRVLIPELNGIVGPTGQPMREASMRLHRRVAPRVQSLFYAWAKAGLMRYVLTFDGAFVARYIRGSITSLSNHAWGTAFDLNAEWNGLGAAPAPSYKIGSVLPLVRIARDHGFYWGGNFSRKDGMHFECARLD